MKCSILKWILFRVSFLLFVIVSSACHIKTPKINQLRVEAEQGDFSPHVSTPNIEELRVKADQGDASSQHMLGDLYLEGFGDTLDYKEAVKWYTKAAEQGYPEAQFSLGSMYENGRGIKTDRTMAAKWYRKAYEKGHPGASLALAKLYENPRSWKKSDYENAVKFAKVA